MQLLNHEQIKRKITRLAMEILERNTEESELYILGVNTRGMELAKRLVREMRTRSNAPLELRQLTISPARPLVPGPVLEGAVQDLAGKAILLVDDVANTGRTLFYALTPLTEILPSKIEVAVLVDRRHKSWPVYVTYRGMDLSTTVGDNVLVNFGGAEGDGAVLE